MTRTVRSVLGVKLSDGEKLEGQLHSSLTLEDAATLMGRTLDLDSAYKQLLVRESSLWCSVLQVYDPDGCPHLFVSQVLPFGASAAVYSFNRLSRSLQHIGTRLFGQVWTSYFDDYTQIDVAASGSNPQQVAESFLDLVGWKYSMKESKRMPMSSSFAALGVEFT